MKALETVAKLYTLLSEFSADDLTEASAIADNSHMGLALRALARAKREIEEKQRRRHPDRHVSENKKSHPAKNGIESKLERVVLDPNVFESNHDVAKFLTSLGLPATFRGKDGRQKMLHRLRYGLDRVAEDHRRAALSKLASALPKSETSGWFEAIRGNGE